MIEHMAGIATRTGLIRGFPIKSLMTCVRLVDSKPALEQAEDLVHLVFEEHPLFTPDNKFVIGRGNGHTHGNLRALVGAADYALYVNDPVLFGRIDALYRYVRSQGTRFGFLPELVGRKGDIISCETCALMDFVGLGVTLANNGHPEYWGDVERMVRNQLLESQVADASWMKPGTQPDTDQFTWHDVGQRMLGGYAGWSSPTHILAAKEYLPWGGPELRSNPRAFQNCCGGSGTHGFFIAWKNSAAVRQRHAFGPHALRQAPARGRNPLLSALPGPRHHRIEAAVQNPRPHPRLRAVGRDRRQVKSPARSRRRSLAITCSWAIDRRARSWKSPTPWPIREETETIGNPGRRQYEYRVTWKGDTVVRMTPVGEGVKAATGYSDFNRKEVEIFYGEPGPGRLYQRERCSPRRPAACAAAPGRRKLRFLVAALRSTGSA